MSTWTEYEEPVGYASPFAPRPRGEAADNALATQEAEFQASPRAPGGSVMAPDLLAPVSLTDAMTEQERGDEALTSDQERIGTKDSRRPVLDTWAVPFRWICSLRVTYAAGPASRGTGVLVGPRQVLTAAHCLYRKSDGAGPRAVAVSPGRSGRTHPVGTFTAVTFTLPSAFLAPTGGRSSAVDIAMITLGQDIDGVVPRGAAQAGPLGYWGHPRWGRGSRIRALNKAFLAGKSVSVTGYPKDSCGARFLAAGLGCDRRDLASVPFFGNGMVSFSASLPGLLLHTADTFGGQSGGPVWLRTKGGSLYLVGIHLGPRVQLNPTTRQRLKVKANKARYLDANALALIRSWMPGVESKREVPPTAEISL